MTRRIKIDNTFHYRDGRLVRSTYVPPAKKYAAKHRRRIVSKAKVAHDDAKRD